MSPRKPLFKLADLLSPKIYLAALFLLLLAGYTIYRTEDLIRGPELVINAPINYQTLTAPVVEIRGLAKRISHIYLNQGQIFTDEDGRFTEKLILAPGYNQITLEIKDQFGRYAKQTLELVYN